jgi:signal transduction histidine kinase
VLILVALLPILGFEAYVEYDARHTRQQVVEDEALRLTRLVASGEQQLINGSEQVLDALASTPAVQDDRRPQCSRILANMLRRSPRYSNINVVGLDGLDRCAAIPGTYATSYSDRFWFKEALRTGGFVVGEYLTGRIIGVPMINVAKPFTNTEGQVEGVIVAALNLAWLGEQLKNLPLPLDVGVSISDRNGTILARFPDPQQTMGRPIATAIRFTLEGDKIGLASVTDRDGREVILGYSPPGADPKGLLVVVRLNRVTTFASATQANRTGLLLIIAGATLAVLITLVLGKHLIREPLQRLLTATERWGSGDLAARTGIPADEGEFGRLGRALDRMAERLAGREEELQKLNENLERRVAEEVSAREAMQSQVAHSERMLALGQLAGGIAHDFNNVIQAVQGAAELITCRPEEQERVRSLGRVILQSASRGAAVTRRLLTFSRYSDLRAEPVDAPSLFAETKEILTHTLGAGILVKVEVEGDLPPLIADKAQLQTALVNLATNARDAMNGTGTLTLTAALERIPNNRDPACPVALEAGSYIRLSVSDTGTGMSPDVLARASEPFFTTKAVGQGTGLGLSMAHGFAAQSGGGLHIESTLGSGTVVKLWLPVADNGATPTTRLPEHLPPVASSKEAHPHLLLVDDDPDVKETLAQQIEAEGYVVLTAAGGAEALALLDANQKADLIVTDLSMPGMDGVALIREAQRRRPQLPAILLTGFATDGATTVIGREISGRFTLLQKPISGKALAERAAVLLAGATAAR